MAEQGILPNGQVPVLQHEGRNMNQSVPILRYLGSLHGYYNGADAEAAYAADLTIETLNDIFNKDFYMGFFGTEVMNEEAVNKLVASQDKCFKLLESQLGENKFFGGETCNIADFYVAAFVYAFARNEKGNQTQAHAYKALGEALSANSVLSAWADRMGAELEEHLKNRFDASL